MGAVGIIKASTFNGLFPEFSMPSPVAANVSQPVSTPQEIRHDWSREEVEALFALPFNDLLFAAQVVHRQVF